MKRSFKAVQTAAILSAALLCCAVSSVLSSTEMATSVGLGNAFAVFTQKGEVFGVVNVDASFVGTYAMDLSTGVMPIPRAKTMVDIVLTLTVADIAIDPVTGKAWGVEFYSMLGDKRELIPLGPDGRYHLLVDPSLFPAGLLRIPILYRYRAGRDYSGFRLLGVKFTLDAKTGAGAGASTPCLHIVEAPILQLFPNGQPDKLALFAWATAIQRMSIAGTDTYAVGGLRPLFTLPTAADQKAAIDAAIEAAVVKAQADFRKELERVHGEDVQAAKDLKKDYDKQIGELTERLKRETAKAAKAELTPVKQPCLALPFQVSYPEDSKGKLMRISARSNLTVQVNFGPGCKPVPQFDLTDGQESKLIRCTPQLRVTIGWDGQTKIYGPDGLVEVSQ